MMTELNRIMRWLCLAALVLSVVARNPTPVLGGLIAWAFMYLLFSWFDEMEGR